MPELPEVESLRRSLCPYILGQKIISILVNKPKLVSSKGTVRVESEEKKLEFINQLTNETIDKVDRIAKNLVFYFKSGKIMLVHLKMTGQLVYKSKNSNLELSDKVISGGHPIELSQTKLPNKHSHIIFELENGTLYFNDTRMFGYLLFYQDYQALESEKHFVGLGVDPLDQDFTLDYFKNALKIRKSKLKSVFLSQEVVIGLGNIYADEVCFAGKVRPDRICSSLNDQEISDLYNSIKFIIPLAIDSGGSSVANYLLADGSKGNYAREHKVYKRAGKQCFVCGSVLEKNIINTRTTVFCPKCQK